MKKEKEGNLFEKIASLAKRRGFIYPGSEIYGGLAGTWDYGPLGAELKRNIKNEFWKNIVQERDNIVGLDAAIIMNPRVWEASGHLESFSDPLVECKKCHHRFRADQLSNDKCPDCDGELTIPKQFNLMVETYLGVIEGEKLKTYLRGEITQGVHVNFKNVLDSTRVKLPFGIAQIGKAFRNEITPGDFTFRSREFEQMELQYYVYPVRNKIPKASVSQSPIERISNGVKPGEIDSMEWVEHWKEERMNWYISLGMNKKNLRFKEHEKLAHYAQAAFDIEYHADNEWREMEGIHHRGDWDLRRHQEFSKQDLTYFDEETKERFLPYIIETSGGVDRATLFFLMDAYHEEEERTILKIHPKIAPYKAAVFPLLANKPQLVELAEKIYKDLKKEFSVAWDARGNIGKRYYSQDEIGTPFCITVDFDSLEKGDVTVRDRDTAKQERIKIEELKEYLAKKLFG